MKHFPFTAKVRATLVNGDVVNETIHDYVVTYSQLDAEAEVDGIIREIVGEWDGDTVDAPVESVEILSVEWL